MILGSFSTKERGREVIINHEVRGQVHLPTAITLVLVLLTSEVKEGKEVILIYLIRKNLIGDRLGDGTLLGFLFRLLRTFGLFYFALPFTSFDTTLFGFAFTLTVSFDSIRFACFDLVSSIAESPTSMISSF